MPVRLARLSVLVLFTLTFQAAPIRADETYTEADAESSCEAVLDLQGYCVYLYIEVTATCMHASATVLQCGGSVHVYARGHGILAPSEGLPGDVEPSVPMPGELMLQGEIWYEGCGYDYDPAGSTCHAYHVDPYEVISQSQTWVPALGQPNGELLVDRTLPWQTFDCAALPCDWANINVHAGFTAKAGVGIHSATVSLTVFSLAMDYV